MFNEFVISRRVALGAIVLNLFIFGAVCDPAYAAASGSDDAMNRAIAPKGVLRASINVGNAVLARIDTTTGEPAGVSVDLARALAQRLHVPLQLIVVKTAANSVSNLESQVADVGFFAVDPRRARGQSFRSS